MDLKTGLERFAFTGPTDQVPFKAVLIYEDFSAGVRARRFCQRLAGKLNSTLEDQMWNFEVLGIREVRNLAASAARKADLVVVSATGSTELPEAIRAWLDLWLWILEDENPALVALFDTLIAPESTSIRLYLRQLTQRRGIDFFSPEIAFVPGQELVSIISASKLATTAK